MVCYCSSWPTATAYLFIRIGCATTWCPDRGRIYYSSEEGRCTDSVVVSEGVWRGIRKRRNLQGGRSDRAFMTLILEGGEKPRKDEEGCYERGSGEVAN